MRTPIVTKWFSLIYFMFYLFILFNSLVLSMGMQISQTWDYSCVLLLQPTIADLQRPFRANLPFKQVYNFHRFLQRRRLRLGGGGGEGGMRGGDAGGGRGGGVGGGQEWRRFVSCKQSCSIQFFQRREAICYLISHCEYFILRESLQHSYRIIPFRWDSLSLQLLLIVYSKMDVQKKLENFFHSLTSKCRKQNLRKYINKSPIIIR